MMRRRKILLTGATGLLGRYLLRDLLVAGREVAVLVRDSRQASAQERIEEIIAFGSQSSGVQLPRPVVLQGDVSIPGFGLNSADRAWVARSCYAALHAAACTGFRTTDGEPWKTNVAGTRH